MRNELLGVDTAELMGMCDVVCLAWNCCTSRDVMCFVVWRLL